MVVKFYVENIEVGDLVINKGLHAVVPKGSGLTYGWRELWNSKDFWKGQIFSSGCLKQTTVPKGYNLEGFAHGFYWVDDKPGINWMVVIHTETFLPPGLKKTRPEAPEYWMIFLKDDDTILDSDAVFTGKKREEEIMWKHVYPEKPKEKRQGSSLR